MTAVEKLINVANGEIGYLEKATNSQLDSKTANAGSNNYTKYWRDVKSSYQGQPWCACFVTWCMNRAFGIQYCTQLLYHYPYVYCPTLGSYGKNSGQLYTYKNAKAGDIVIFHNGSEYNHTGIVVSNTGSSIVTIEGNTSGGSTVVANGGGVAKKTYSYSYLANSKPYTRFFRPKYEIIPVENPITFTDTQGHYAKKHIDKLVNYGIVQGYGDNTFRPDDNITRAEFSTMITNTLEKVMKISLKSTKTFSDIQGHWAESSIRKLATAGIVNGFDNGKFYPDNNILRNDACIIAQNMLTTCGKGIIESTKAVFPDIIDNYAIRHIMSLYAYGVVNGYDDGLFHPLDNVTRGQAAIIIANCLTVLGK